MDDIYEVTRDEYVGFLNQIKPDCRDIKKTDDSFAVYSKKTGKLLCKRVLLEDGAESHYIYEMPDDSERQEGRPVRKIVLKTQEQAQAFFDALSKAMKKND